MAETCPECNVLIETRPTNNGIPVFLIGGTAVFEQGTKTVHGAVRCLHRLRRQRDGLQAIINKLPLSLMADYLGMFADRLSCDGCEDAELADTPDNRAFWIRVCGAEGMDETDWLPERPGEPILAQSTLVARHLAREAAEAAEEKSHG